MSHCGWSSCDLGQLDASLCRGASTKLTLKSLLLARQLERAAHAGRDPALLGALRRAAAGEPLVIWGIGGSTTQGRDSPVTYGHLFARWLSSALPPSLEHAPEGSYRGHLYMPHARSSTGSAGFVDAVPAMGRQRGYRGLIRQTGWTGVREGRPDLILMEHGVNDVDYTRGVWKTVDLRQGCSTRSASVRTRRRRLRRRRNRPPRRPPRAASRRSCARAAEQQLHAERGAGRHRVLPPGQVLQQPRHQVRLLRRRGRPPPRPKALRDAGGLAPRRDLARPGWARG